MILKPFSVELRIISSINLNCEIMKAITLLQTVISYKSTTTCKVKNMEQVIEELKSMKANKIAPKRLVNRALKIAENNKHSV